MKVFGIFVVVVVVCQAALSAGKSTAVKPDVPVKNVGGKIIQNSGIQVLNIISDADCDESGRPDEEEPVEVKPAEEEEEEEPEETVKIPDGYEVIDGVGAYKLYKENLVWNEARKACEKDGAHLAAPDSEAELEEIKKLVVNEFLVFLGAHTLFGDDDVWTTVLDEPMTMKFSRNNPDNPKTEHCLSTFPDGLNDSTCDSKYPYLCEIQLNKKV